MTFKEMEKTLIGLADIQGENQKLLTQTLGAVNKFSKLVVEFAEQQNASLLRVEEAVARLTGEVEAFVRGRPHNGRKQRS